MEHSKGNDQTCSCAVDGRAARQHPVVADEDIRRLQRQAEADPNLCCIAGPAHAINREIRVRRAFEISCDASVDVGVIMRPASTCRKG